MKSNWKYAIIYWSEEDRSYIAEVPELPGCAADGPTYRQALAAAKVVIHEWIDTAKELKRSIPNRRDGCYTRRPGLTSLFRVVRTISSPFIQLTTNG